jgi:hypothetical protein
MPASAGPIGPGFDLFQTVPFTAELSVLGMVPLVGVPIGPGNTDTIVQRMGDLPSGEGGMLPIELVALSLMSSQPVDIGGSFFDVFADVILQPLTGGNPVHMSAPVLHLDDVGATWSHTPPPEPSTVLLREPETRSPLGLDRPSRHLDRRVRLQREGTRSKRRASASLSAPC